MGVTIRDYIDDKDRTGNDSFTVNGTKAVREHVDEDDKLTRRFNVSGQNRERFVHR